MAQIYVMNGKTHIYLYNKNDSKYTYQDIYTMLDFYLVHKNMYHSDTKTFQSQGIFKI